MTPTDREPAGQALGSRYELVEVIGAGAMGKVWRAWDRTDQTYRAAKALRSELTSDPEILTRFIQERSILLGLRHPNIVEVYDLVVEGDNLAIVMELVEGPGLRGHMRAEGTLAPAEALQIAASVLDALAVAHAAGTLHRDVKPDNILLAQGRGSIAEAVKLTDFGIARLAQESTVQATGLLGTPSYMPPELFERGVTSAASDVYAVGIMLYEMIAGRTPFAGGGTAHTIGFRHLTAVPPRLDIDPAVWAALETMLDKDPRKRLSASATAAQLRELLPLVEGVPAGPRQVEPSDWERVQADDGTVQRAIRPQSLSSTEDVGGTRLRGRGGSEPDVFGRAVEGSVDAFVTGIGDDEGFTQVRNAPVHRAAAPTLTSGVEPKTINRKPLYWVLGGVVVLALIVGGLAIGGVFSSSHATHKTSALGPASVSYTPQTTWAAGGLTYTSQADYQPGQGVTLSLTFTYQYPITGNLLVVVPDLGSQQATGCADTVNWSGPSVRFTSLQTASQNPISCGYELTPTGSPNGDSLSVTAQIASPTGQTAAQLKTWLQAIDSGTASAVSGYGGQKSDYVLQEIDHLRVLVSPGSGQYAVAAVWSGSSDANAYPLFSTSTGGTVGPTLAILFGLTPVAGYPFSELPANSFVSASGNGCTNVGVNQQGVFNAGNAQCQGTFYATIGKVKGQAQF